MDTTTASNIHPSRFAGPETNNVGLSPEMWPCNIALQRCGKSKIPPKHESIQHISPLKLLDAATKLSIAEYRLCRKRYTTTQTYTSTAVQSKQREGTERMYFGSDGGQLREIYHSIFSSSLFSGTQYHRGSLRILSPFKAEARARPQKERGAQRREEKIMQPAFRVCVCVFSQPTIHTRPHAKITTMKTTSIITGSSYLLARM